MTKITSASGNKGNEAGVELTSGNTLLCLSVLLLAAHPHAHAHTFWLLHRVRAFTVSGRWFKMRESRRRKMRLPRGNPASCFFIFTAWTDEIKWLFVCVGVYKYAYRWVAIREFLCILCSEVRCPEGIILNMTFDYVGVWRFYVNNLLTLQLFNSQRSWTSLHLILTKLICSLERWMAQYIIIPSISVYFNLIKFVSDCLRARTH